MEKRTMFFGKSSKRKREYPTVRANFERSLAKIASKLPEESACLLLIHASGLVQAAFPPQPDEDRVSAMTAAANSLGARINRELNHGELQYVIVAGTEGIHIVTILERDLLLSLTLPKVKNLSVLLKALHEVLVEVDLFGDGSEPGEPG
jgi:predicted regulator of Ras-like GTPase activity (Roadblock/LC7/MglB family)